jgi:hypothetical protein
MAFTYRADAQILNPFSEYIVEQTTARSAFLTSGLVDTNPVISQNIQKGDTFSIPNWAANLGGTIQIPAESVQLTVNKLGSAKQIGVIYHAAQAWGASELVKLAVGAGNDPLPVIGSKIASYVANVQQAYLLSTLKGAFGVPGTDNSSYALAALSIDAGGSGETDLSVSHVVRADLILGEDADKYGIMVVHPDVYAYLRIREMINYVDAAEAPGITASTIAAGSITASNAVPGDFSGAFSQRGAMVPFFGSKRIIVSDDAPRTGSAGSYKYSSYVFKPGAVGMGYQAPIRTEQDRDILTSGGEDVVKVQWDQCFHVLGTSYAGTAVGSSVTRTILETAASWTKVFDKKNIGVANIVHTCPIYG